MTRFNASVQIAAPPDRVWAVLADVPRWPEWTPTVTAALPLGAPALVPGAQYRLIQPKLQPAVWTVAALAPGRRFAWISASPGVRATADHVLTADNNGTRVDLSVEFSGGLGWLVGWLMGGLTQDYISREAAALKARVEFGA